MNSSSSKPRIGLLIGSTREGRFGELPAGWLLTLSRKHPDFELEPVDLRDFPIPLFNESAPPVSRPARDAQARRWTEVLERLDGLIVVTPEYNHGPPAVLKNALDHVAHELARKPIAFLGYGDAGAARAIEQLRLVAIELEMVPLRAAVHLGPDELAEVSRGERGFGDYPHLVKAAQRLIRHMGWWATLLSAHRYRDEAHTPG